MCVTSVHSASDAISIATATEKLFPPRISATNGHTMKKNGSTGHTSMKSTMVKSKRYRYYHTALPIGKLRICVKLFKSQKCLQKPSTSELDKHDAPEPNSLYPVEHTSASPTATLPSNKQLSYQVNQRADLCHLISKSHRRTIKQVQ